MSRFQIAPQVAGLASYQPGKPIEETKRELGLDDVIKLASNENPFGPSPKATVAIAEALSELHRYPDGSGFHLKRALVRHLAAQGHTKTPDELVLGNGSNEILVFMMRALATSGANMVIGWPSFVVYPIAGQAAGFEVRRVPLVDYRYDVRALLEHVDATTRLVVVGHPNNPTGTYIPKPDLQRLADGLRDDIVLVVDEAYFEYADAPDYMSGLDLERKNVFVLRTLSKAYGLAGLRLGYGIGDKALVGYLNRVREPFNVNALALVGGAASLDDTAHVERSVRENARERARVGKAIAELGFLVVATQANFVLVDFRKPAMPIYDALLKQGVITRPMSPYDLHEHLRISFGTAAENDRLLRALGTVALGTVRA
ncbi:MAG: histidinol-phosphate transaminase [Deltaproteobacteria bacterium]|nr:histidinol-phosphate transaminase [Deltaproteobacteria bacterium]